MLPLVHFKKPQHLTSRNGFIHVKSCSEALARHRVDRKHRGTYISYGHFSGPSIRGAATAQFEQIRADRKSPARPVGGRR